ncbi:MAG: hypothetical protein ACOYOK_10675 [Pseudobdellovibrionaceae bacterium]
MKSSFLNKLLVVFGVISACYANAAKSTFADRNSEIEKRESIAVNLANATPCDKSLKISAFDSFVNDNGDFIVVIAESSVRKSDEDYGVIYLRDVTFSKTNKITVSTKCEK